MSAVAVNEYKTGLPKEVQDLNEYFDTFLERFLAEVQADNEIPDEGVKRLRKMFKYTCVGGKAFRGCQVIAATQESCKHLKRDFEGVKEAAHALAWAVEVLQACFLVADDIMDKSHTRRGQPCWYLVPGTGMDAVNDSLILESFMNWLIRTCVTDKATFLRVNELFLDVSLKTQIGQMYDLNSQPQGRKGLDVLNSFSLDLYKRIVKYKTAFYTFFLPMACGLVLAGVTDSKQLAATREICVELGEKFQIQDDFLDCYGDPAAIGKVGTDIQDHKCTWLLVQALLRVTPGSPQRKVIEENLGHEEPEKIAAIKRLYGELDIPAVYAAQEEASKQRLDTLLAKHDSLPPSLFTSIIARVHGRKK